MFQLLGSLGTSIPSAKPYASFLHKDIKQLASSLTAVINHASISSRTMSSISLNFATVLLHICLFLLSNRSELNLPIKRHITFWYEISFDVDHWKRLSASMCPFQYFHILILALPCYAVKSEYQQCSLAVLQTSLNVELFTQKPTQYVSKDCKVR